MMKKNLPCTHGQLLISEDLLSAQLASHSPRNSIPDIKS